MRTFLLSGFWQNAAVVSHRSLFVSLGLDGGRWLLYGVQVVSP
jgi:hypothetical protein